MLAGKPFITPLQPSSLRSLSGAALPASPLSPIRARLHSPPLPSPRSVPDSPAVSSFGRGEEAPAKPMPWIWSCHKCHTRYPLGATRRCLNDGHYFCGGVTFDSFTGKTKKHRACASEFDYIGWENHGKWKTRVTKDQSLDELGQHCGRKCDFPSACHWRSKHTPKKTANFNFLDPKCLDAEVTDTSSASDKSNTPTLKKTGLYIDKIVKAAEKRTSQLTTLLSTVEEETNFTSMPGYVPAPTSAPPKLPELPSLSGLGLSFPVLDFSNLKRHLDGSNDSPTKGVPKATPPETSTPELSASVATIEDDDVKMTDWLSDDPISPSSKTDTEDDVPFHSSLDPSHGPQASLADEQEEDDSPISPRRNAWDWTAGDIGIALGSPTKPIYEESWDDPIEDETEKEWEKELGLVDRRPSI